MTATVLLDTLSLYHAVKRLYGSKIDYGALLDDINGRVEVEHCIAYVLNIKDNAAFVKMLEAKGVTAIELCTEEDYGIRLAVDALMSESQLVVLATANPMFAPLWAALGADEALAYSPYSEAIPHHVACVEIADNFVI